MRKVAIELFAVVFISGCATATLVPYQVVSEPPGAQIEVNGVSMGTAPTTIELQCSKRWVGVAVAPGGWAYDRAEYQVSAYPSKDNPGSSQSKRINACQVATPPGHLYFDLGLDAVTPRQRIDLNITSSDKTSSLDETIQKLKALRNQGLLSEQEYQQKIDQAVTNASR